MPRLRFLPFVVIVFGLLVLPGPVPIARAQTKFDAIKHVIIIYLENHTVDNLYSLLPGVNGINSPGAQITQVDKQGVPFPTLPPVKVSFRYDGFGSPIDTLPGLPDPRFPSNLPNKPFLIDQYVPNDVLVGTPAHRFYLYQLQINGGKMDKYVAWTDVGAQVMGYYDSTKLPLFPYARDYTFADNYFTAAFGGSWLNHMWLVCACTPKWDNAPPEYIAHPKLDAQGKLIGEDDNEFSLVTPDGYADNTGVDAFYPPHSSLPDSHRLPPSDFPTIGDRLSAAGISWTEYNGGWQDALSGKVEQPIPLVPMPPLSSHQYFKPYGPGMPGRDHLHDAINFVPDVINGNLSTVTILKPDPAFDEHPGYSVTQTAEQHALLLIQAIQLSKYWQDSVIFITYDDFGGWYDHVPPPVIDRWGPGGRVPLLVISPYAKKNFVDHTQYDTTSLLKFIETRWNLQSLGTRDAQANDLSNVFDFNQAPPTTVTAPRSAFGQDQSSSVPAAPDQPIPILAAPQPDDNFLVSRQVFYLVVAILVLLVVSVIVLFWRRGISKRA